MTSAKGFCVAGAVGQRRVDQTGAAPEGRERGHVGGALHPLGAADDEHGPHRALVVERALGDDELAHRLVGEQPDVGAVVAQRRDADGRDHHLAAERAARRDEVAHLGGVQGHGEVGLHGRPVHGAGARADAAHDVDADHGAGRLVDELDDRGRLALGGAGEPGAEDRVDHHVGHLREDHGVLGERPALARRGAHVHAQRREDVEVQPGVAPVLVRRREQEHGDLDARVEELARDHEPVPAVVALAGEDHGLLGLVPLEDLGRHGEAGALHEVPAGDADAVDRRAVDLLHAVGGVQAQQQGLIHPRPP